MTKLNAAQLLRQAIGIEAANGALKQREVSHTKSGPGRRHADGTGKRADKTLKQLSAGSYGRGLRNQRERQNRDAMERKALPRDQHGAVSLIGPRVEFEGVKPGADWFIVGGSTAGTQEDFCYTARRIWTPATFRNSLKVSA